VVNGAVEGNTKCGVAVLEGGRVTVEGGRGGENRETGVFVADKGSEARVVNCAVEENTNSGVAVLDGGRVTVEGGRVAENGHEEVSVEDEGSEARVVLCSIAGQLATRAFRKSTADEANKK
jgi:hypothetical protein